MNIPEFLKENNTNLSEICKINYQKLFEESGILDITDSTLYKEIAELSMRLAKYWRAQTVACDSYCIKCSHCITHQTFDDYARVVCDCSMCGEHLPPKYARALKVDGYTMCVGGFFPRYNVFEK